MRCNSTFSQGDLNAYYKTIRQMGLTEYRGLKQTPFNPSASWRQQRLEGFKQQPHLVQEPYHPGVRRIQAVLDKLDEVDPAGYPNTLFTNRIGFDDDMAESGGGGIYLIGRKHASIDDNELAGVLGHERGHDRHGDWALESALEALGSRVKGSYSRYRTPDASPTQQQFVTELDEAYLKFATKMNHIKEFQADAAGARYAMRAGFSPDGFKRHLNSHPYLENETHPAPERRIALIDRVIAAEQRRQTRAQR